MHWPQTVFTCAEQNGLGGGGGICFYISCLVSYRITVMLIRNIRTIDSSADLAFQCSITEWLEVILNLRCGSFLSATEVSDELNALYNQYLPFSFRQGHTLTDFRKGDIYPYCPCPILSFLHHQYKHFILFWDFYIAFLPEIFAPKLGLS